MANPSNLRWVGPTTYSDGTPYRQVDHGGYEIQVEKNGVPRVGAVAVPVQWATNNQYEFPVASIVDGSGTYIVRVRTVASNGNTSDWSAPLSFEINDRIPNPPTSLQAV